MAIISSSRQSRLSLYGAERDHLLHRITDLLRDDPCVAAAWLFGSLGRGDADDRKIYSRTPRRATNCASCAAWRLR
jgi:hypothetical protein